MKKEEKEVREYHVEKFTENGKAVFEAILTALQQRNVKPDDIEPVLAEGLTRLLVAVGRAKNYDPVQYVHNFGKAIATCNIEMKKGKEG